SASAASTIGRPFARPFSASKREVDCDSVRQRVVSDNASWFGAFVADCVGENTRQVENHFDTMPSRVNAFRNHHALTGEDLAASIESTEATRPALIESLALEETSLMVSSPPGQGKSAILLTAVAQSSVGLPVFGELPCARPLRSYIFCPERSARELK